MTLLGLPAGRLRRPYLALEPAEVAVIGQALAELGLPVRGSPS